MTLIRSEKIYLAAVMAMLGGFAAALFVAAFVFNVRLPTFTARINPQNLKATEFAQPGLVKTGNTSYDLRIVAKMWQFDAGPQFGTPPVIKIPRGSTINFRITSQDVIHGFYIEDHAVNFELIPGQIAAKSVTFNRTGNFKIICHQFCGSGHQVMYGSIIVE